MKVKKAQAPHKNKIDIFLFEIFQDLQFFFYIFQIYMKDPKLAE